MRFGRAGRTSQGRPALYGRARRFCPTTASACVPVLVIGYAVRTTHGARVVDTASI